MIITEEKSEGIFVLQSCHICKIKRSQSEAVSHERDSLGQTTDE